MLDKGPDLDKRRCPARETGRCLQCATCALITGWGGAGAFSDGKLTITTQVGGLAADIRGDAEANWWRRWMRCGCGSAQTARAYHGERDQSAGWPSRPRRPEALHCPITTLAPSEAAHRATCTGAGAANVEVRTRTDVARL
jgi:hypothetical protein